MIDEMLVLDYEKWFKILVIENFQGLNRAIRCKNKILQAKNYWYGCGVIMMKKNYIMLFIACFAVFLILNFRSLFQLNFSTAIAVILMSLIETLIVYLIIILIIHVANRYSRLSQRRS